MKISNDPYPVSIFNEKQIPDTKIHKYLDSHFYYYLNIYLNIKDFGLYEKSWLDVPNWTIQLFRQFQNIEKEYEIYLQEKYKS